MLFFQTKNEIARMAGLDWLLTEEDRERRRRFMAQMKGIRFGNSLNFLGTATYTLAGYSVPRDVWMIVFRTEVTMTDFTSGSADFGLTERIPSRTPAGALQTAFWRLGPYGVTTGASTETITDLGAGSHLALDVDEFLIIKGGQGAFLLATLTAIGDALTRNIMTTVYAFLTTGEVVNSIGGQATLITTVG